MTVVAAFSSARHRRNVHCDDNHYREQRDRDTSHRSSPSPRRRRCMSHERDHISRPNRARSWTPPQRHRAPADVRKLIKPGAAPAAAWGANDNIEGTTLVARNEINNICRLWVASQEWWRNGSSAFAGRRTEIWIVQSLRAWARAIKGEHQTKTSVGFSQIVSATKQAQKTTSQFHEVFRCFMGYR